MTITRIDDPECQRAWRQSLINERWREYYDKLDTPKEHAHRARSAMLESEHHTQRAALVRRQNPNLTLSADELAMMGPRKRCDWLTHDPQGWLYPPESQLI